MTFAVIAFVGLLAAAIFLGKYLEDHRLRDALASLFGFVLLGTALVGIFT